MNPAEHKFITIPQFIGIAQSYPSSIGWIFRGQSDSSWSLRPKAGRPEYYLAANEYSQKKHQVSGDLARFEVWREQAIAVCDSLPSNDFDCLAYAQHYGLATRLLDWTTNPLVALFFATENEPEKEGAVFCHFPWWLIDRKMMSLYNNILGSQVLRLVPSQFDRRIVAQSALFTYHYNPVVPLEASNMPPEAVPLNGANLAIIRVMPKTKQIIQKQLVDLGISRKSLFPDLEGVSSFVNFETRNTVRLQNQKEAERFNL